MRRCSPQHLHAALLRELIDLSRVDLCFMVVRDPIARFRSEYAMRQKDPSKTDAASVEAWAARVLGRYERNPYALDNHLRPQHEFLLPDTEVFRLEDGLDTMIDQPQRALRARRAQRGGPPAQEQPTGTASPAATSRSRRPWRRRLRELYAEDFRQFGF